MKERGHGMNPALKAVGRAALTFLCLAALLGQGMAVAQSSLAPGMAAGGAGGSDFYSGASAGSAGLGGYSGYGNGANGSGYTPGGMAGQQGPLGAGGYPAQGGAVGTFQPSTLPDYSILDRATGTTPALDVAKPAEIGTPTPLYAHPTGTPGQFELLKQPPAPLSEFEAFVAQTVGKPLPRFGSQLVLQRTQGFAAPSTAAVPPDYRLQPGDELVISISGSVEAHLRLIIDSEGKIFVPRVGSIDLAGIRYGDLQDALSRRFSEQFKQARVSVVMGRLHGLTVYVTGFAVSPGAYVVSSLATAADAALVAGGPNAGGSFRNITVRRGGRVVTHLDLYDLLISGDKSQDTVLQNGDVINIEPVGPEVAVAGSVNMPAIYEAKDGETYADMVRYAGGPDSLADDTRLVVRRLSDLDRGGSREISMADARHLPAERASVVSVLSLAQVARPLERQEVLVTIDGEVDKPGRYFIPAGSTMGDLLGRAGGLTSGAYVYGAEIDRVSVREQQKASYERALDDLELAALTAPLSSLNSTINPYAGQARAQAAQAIIARLRSREPNGRIILNMPVTSTNLPPDLTIENNDHIFVPPRPKTVSVFGAVFQSGAFLYSSGSRVRDYLHLAGGPQRIADKGEVFVVRANGSVLSSRQTHDFWGQPAYPGDVIFVPVRTGPSLFDRIVTISAVISQFGVTALTAKALGL